MRCGTGGVEQVLYDMSVTATTAFVWKDYTSFKRCFVHINIPILRLYGFHPFHSLNHEIPASCVNFIPLNQLTKSLFPELPSLLREVSRSPSPVLRLDFKVLLQISTKGKLIQPLSSDHNPFYSRRNPDPPLSLELSNWIAENLHTITNELFTTCVIGSLQSIVHRATSKSPHSSLRACSSDNCSRESGGVEFSRSLFEPFLLIVLGC